jgi:integrase
VTINYFLLGVYSGLRFSDWQRFSYDGFIQGDRIILGAKKNGEIIGMKMHDKLKAVVERLRTMPAIYSEPKTNEYLKGIATLAGINKNITCHVSRHTYCTHCLRLGIQDDVIAQTMGITLKTLQIYKHLLDSEVDSEIGKWNS